MKIIRLFLFILLFLAVLLAGALMFYEPAQAANYPLEIIQPRAGLTTGANATNRFYKAYPHLEYNVKVAVIGGAWPFTYSLTQAPSGMTINATTGVISWSDPQNTSTIGGVQCGSTNGCPVIARVIDAEGTSASVTWRIWVPSDISTPAASGGFLFVDASQPNTPPACNLRTGANADWGSITRPLKSISDWYCGTTTAAKGDNTYKNYFVYYRAGTYTTTANNNQASLMMQINSLYKPVVHLAYPGETVNFDVGNGAWQIGDNSPSPNAYFDGFNFTNIAPLSTFTCTIRALSFVDWPGDNVTVRRNTFSNVAPRASSGCNPSMIFFGGLMSSGWSYYRSVTENTFSNISSSYALLSYTTQRALFEYNTLDNFSDSSGSGASHPLGLKACNDHYSVRNNTFTNTAQDAIESLYVKSVNGVSCAGTSGSGYFDISFNKVISSGGHSVNFNADCTSGDIGGPVWIYRNTLVTGRLEFFCASSSNGPFYVYQNVIQNSTTSPATHVICTSCTTTIKGASGATLGATENLVGTSGIVDASGDLTTAYQSYLGSFGYQLYGSVKKPNPPTNARIQ